MKARSLAFPARNGLLAIPAVFKLQARASCLGQAPEDDREPMSWFDYTILTEPFEKNKQEQGKV